MGERKGSGLLPFWPREKKRKRLWFPEEDSTPGEREGPPLTTAGRRKGGGQI